jgi:site-specific DNA-methyltransferase (adenine-specific)
MASNEVLFADCNRVLPWYYDNQFDLGTFDPPYFSGPEKRGFYGKAISSTEVKRVDYAKTETWELPTLEWFIDIKRICRYWIIWGANYFDFIGTPFLTPRRDQLEAFIKENPKGWIIWDKCNGKTSFNDFELAFTNLDIDTVVIKYMWNGMMHGKSIAEGHIMRPDKKNQEKRIHPTQKPIPLYLWQLKSFAKPGWKILDTHLGSGSSRIASDMLDLNFTGIEKSLVHYNNQEKRFRNYQSQLLLSL